MAGIFGNSMNTSSSSESLSTSFQNEALTSSEPEVTSVALPVFLPKGTMDFRKWATEGWNADGPTLSGPAGEIDYDHEPQISEPNFNADR
jgi:hypothetical protein